MSTPREPPLPSWRAFCIASGASATVLVAVAVVVSLLPHGGPTQSFGDVVQVLAALLATAACVRAARRDRTQRRAWSLLAVGTGIWTVAAIIFWLSGQIYDHVYPFPSVADIGFLGYSLPVVAGLVCFPRQALGLVGRLRATMDCLVIGTAILFITWSWVLEPQLDIGGTLLARLDGLAFPVVDAVITALVLVLGLLRPTGSRLTWMLLGGGLVVLSATDSVYVTLTQRGQTELTGSLLIIGWAAAFLLIAISTLVPSGNSFFSVRRHFTMTQELLPYVPVLAVVVTVATLDIWTDPVLLINGGVLLVFLGIRQVLMFEKVALAGRLDSEVELRTSEQSKQQLLLRAVLESLGTAVIPRDANGKTFLFNQASRELYGGADPPEFADQIVLLEVEGAAGAARIPYDQTPVHRALCGERVRDAEMVLAIGPAVRRAVLINSRPIADATGAALGAVSAMQDITARKRNEVELEVARNKAQESSRLKSEFMATMSHEIRTPMNGVIGLTDLLLGTSLDATQRQYAEGVRGAGEGLLGVMNDILDFAKLEADKVEIEVIDFEPRRLIGDVGGLFAEAALQKKLELVTDCLPDVPPWLRGDVGRIRQVLVNLTSNAVKFTSAGEIVIRVALAPDDRYGPAVRFEVRDTGIGIAAGHRQRLIEPFAQADASTTRRYGGTGLGLAICRQLTEAMGGEIEVTGGEGEGSSFSCTFPLDLAVLDDSTRTAEPAADLLSGLRVHVVVANVTNQTAIAGRLTGWRLRSGVAPDGVTALRLLREAVLAGDPYRLAVVDLSMPHLNGLDLARLIQAAPVLDGTELVGLASVSGVDADVARAAGVSLVLSKPARHAGLYDAIIKLAAHARAEPVTGCPPVAAAPSSLNRGRVLVVEDNTINQLVAEAIVSKLGYQVDIVANGRLAVRATSTTDYCAVLMDCHMPEMDGSQATAAIRCADGDRRHTPIIAMTAGALTEDRQRCLAAGMDDYVSKPVSLDRVKAALNRWVDAPDPSELPREGAPVGLPLLQERIAALDRLV